MKLPIGYEKFHRNKFLNYQLNRWYSLGYARKEDIKKIAEKIRTFDDYINEFKTASDIALKEGRLKNAATYLRASEFLISPDDHRKFPVYKEYIEIFDKAFKDENFERHIGFKIQFSDYFKANWKPYMKNNTKPAVNRISI